MSRLVVECSIFSLSISPESYSGIICLSVTCQVLGDISPSKKNTRKYDFSCTSANFSVPLQPNPTLEGNMSCEKRFAMVLSLGRFLTYLNSVYCALRLTNRKLRNFSNKTVKIKVTVNAYGYDYIHTTSHLGVVCFHPA